MPPRFQKPNIFSGQILTTKMKEVFAKALAHYDNREYDKVIKEANLLLKTFPNHAETLCLKGASMYYSKESTMTQSEKDKCLELIQQGCKNNTNSPICWHLLGLFCRAENLHAEAIDALSKSFNINPSNLNVGRDLSAVQMGIFDYEGFTETRRLIFMMRANRQHVLVFAAGNHLLGKYKESLAVIDAFLKTYKPADNTHETIYEDAELYFYKSQILMDMGDYQGTLDFLEENKDRFVDKIAYNTRVAALYEKLERSTDAETQYRWLLSTNTEEASYHTGLRRSVGCEFTADQVIAKEDGSITLPSDKLGKLTQLYKELLESYPKSNAAKRIPLTFLQGNSFSEALESYVRPKISYGVPTLFSDLRELYTDAAKIDTIQKLFISLAENLSASGKFSPEDENAAASESLLWTYFFLASHFDYIGQSDKANEYLELGLVIAHKISAEAKEKLQAKSVEIVDEIKESTEVKPAIEAKAVPARTPAPTCLTDLLMLKAFINKHDGNSLSAYKSMNESRRSDLFDRYLNTRCTKFAFQAGNDKLAESTVFLFLRGGDTIASLRTNQAIWFVLQQALSYADKKNYNRAIQKFTQVEKIYQEYTNEFSDFHGYQARRGTMRTYYDMIKFQKNIRGHKFYVRSASSYIETLLEYRAFKLQGETKLIDAACAETKLDKNDVIQNKLTAEQKKMYDESMDVLKKNRELSLESTRQTEEILYKEHVAEINEENDVIPKTEAEKAKIAKEIGSDPLGYEELKNLDVDAALEKQIDILLTSNSTSISTTILAIRVFLVLGQLDKVPELLEKLNSQVGLYKSATANTVHPVNEVYFHPQSFALHGVPIGVKRKIVSQYHDAELFVLKNLYNLAKARGVDSEQETITTATAEYVREFIADKESITASRIIASIAAAKIYSSLGLDANIDSLFNYITMDKVQSIDVTSASHLRAPLRSALAMLTDLQPSNGVLINTIREFAHEILPKDIKFLTAEQLKSVQADTIVTKPTVAEDAANPPKPKEEIPEPVEPEQPEVVAPKKVILPIATEKKKFGKKRR